MNHKITSLTFLLFVFTSIILSSCTNHQQADAIYFNGKIYTVDSLFTVADAFAVKDGKILAVGSNDEIQKYDAKEKIDLHGKFVYPGFIDAHCHFFGYGVDLKKINLTGTKSFADVVDTLIKYKNKKFQGWIFGRGWDQNDWALKEYPDKTKLDSLFPDVPVLLLRIDGHAALVNQKAIDMAKLTDKSFIEGGEIERKNGKFTGIFIDNAVDIIKALIPESSHATETEALLAAQKNCFAVGLTTVDDAGLDYPVILLIDSLQKSNQLKMRYYAMITYNSANKNYFFNAGKIKTDRLNVRSFKFYADGALGSRGALMLQPYADMLNRSGFILTPYDTLKMASMELAEHGFQMCTHCIGDSANRMMLNMYGEATKDKNDVRWRIEHCQVVNENDFSLFKKYRIIPSVQPTHATSDMYWAEDRVGGERIKGAYSYKRLMQQNNMCANGSDFPVEDINPLYGFYAAVVRKDKQDFPGGGFQIKDALTREQALRGMTIWAAYANFEENEKGSLEKNKFADFVILEDDLMTAPDEKLWQIKVLNTYINGEKVF